MKYLFTLLLIAVLGTAKSQTKDIKFSPYESSIFEEHAILNKNFYSMLKFKDKKDSVYNVFLTRLIEAYGVDLKKVSVKGDSFVISKEGLKLKLRK